MNNQRPVNLDLATIKFPPMAIASILHRISGIVLFVLLPVMLYFLDLSLRTAETFAKLQAWMLHPSVKFVVWAFLAAYIYHLLAGIRHMMMDMGCGESLQAGARTAKVVIVVSALLTILLGIWIW